MKIGLKHHVKGRHFTNTIILGGRWQTGTNAGFLRWAPTSPRYDEDAPAAMVVVALAIGEVAGTY
jgi:hypothetical protein